MWGILLGIKFIGIETGFKFALKPVLYYVELNGDLFLALWLYLAVVKAKGVKKNGIC